VKVRGMQHLYRLVGFFVVVTVLIVSFAYLSLQPQVTGEITLHGGNITYVNFTVHWYPSTWIGLYGNISNSTGSSTFAISGAQVVAVNLSYDSPLNNTVVVATTGNPDWNNLSSANTSFIDSYMNLSALDQQSGTLTFTDRENFTVGGSQYELWSALTASQTGSYYTGALASNGDLLFITKAQYGVGFDGSGVDYQLMLPLNNSGAANYTFYVFEEDSLPTPSLNCSAPVNITAYLDVDNVSVVVDWDAVSGADSYEVHYLDGPTGGFLDFSSATVVPVGASTSYTDASDPAERYYRVNVISGAQNCLGNQTAGTIEFNLTPEYNMVSTPFVLDNSTVAEALRSIDGDYNLLYEYDNALHDYYFYFIFGNDIFKTFETIKPGKGYWILVTTPTQLRFSGLMFTNVSSVLSPQYNLVGFPPISNVDQNESVGHVLSSIDGNYTLVYEYDNALHDYYFYFIFGNDIFKTFDSIKAGRGYWILVNDNVTLSYSN